MWLFRENTQLNFWLGSAGAAGAIIPDCKNKINKLGKDLAKISPKQLNISSKHISYLKWQVNKSLTYTPSSFAWKQKSFSRKGVIFVLKCNRLPGSEMSSYPGRLLSLFEQHIKQFSVIIRYKKCQKKLAKYKFKVSWLHSCENWLLKRVHKRRYRNCH